eukprot:363306-Chlamydomonas_euryale.AAC.6
MGRRSTRQRKGRESNEKSVASTQANLGVGAAVDGCGGLQWMGVWGCHGWVCGAAVDGCVGLPWMGVWGCNGWVCGAAMDGCVGLQWMGVWGCHGWVCGAAVDGCVGLGGTEVAFFNQAYAQSTSRSTSRCVRGCKGSRSERIGMNKNFPGAIHQVQAEWLQLWAELLHGTAQPSQVEFALPQQEAAASHRSGANRVCGGAPHLHHHAALVDSGAHTRVLEERVLPAIGPRQGEGGSAWLDDYMGGID